ncbi:peptide ABC transporter substrate-binding protein [Hazenella sp. IB182357]|uniref:Peptide ABC transporter substrate-binding protein n=1 Tax=Polycladospora coralii TaxID=2771432 RepID=A0A926N7I1_9BACL|nr:peptide ABC transporter substrate-binding protein [Polycladospora coralii]MBD1370883.1 peptide ABC transporter substrate-binding protein [Polycladospora coralii]
MRNWRKLTSTFAILLVASLVLSACSFGGGDSGDAKGNVINLIETAEPPNLDSARSTDSASFTILNNVNEGLYRLDQDSKPTLGMAAEEPTKSDDNKTYTFKLRDANWSDGKPVTAKDFEYAWKRAMNPDTASEYAFIMNAIDKAEEYNAGKAKAKEVGVKAIDDKTLEIRLKQDVPYLKDLLTFGTFLPQRQDIVEKHGEKYALDPDKMVFNGPFVLSEWKHESSFTYKKNDQYWEKDVVKLDTVNVTISKDATTSMNLYNTGKVDYTGVGSEFIDSNKDKPEYFLQPESTVFYTEMNQIKEDSIFKNAKIRKAVMIGIDRQTEMDKILKNGVPAAGFVSPAIRGNDDKKFRELAKVNIEYNPQEAKKLFDEGLKELGLDKAPTVEIVGDDTSGAKDDLTFVKEQLKQNLGLEVKITSVPFKERLERGKKGNFDLLLGGWAADYNDAMSYLEIFTTGYSYNRGKWSNKQYDELVKKAQANENFDERLEQLLEAEKIMIEDAGIAPGYFRSSPSLINQKIKDMHWHAIGPDYSLKWTYVEEGK